MRTVEVKVFQFSELFEDVQEKVISDMRQSVEFLWMPEYKDSLKAFCDVINISIPHWVEDAWMNFHY